VINDAIYIAMSLLGFALFVRFGRFCRNTATILLWLAAQFDATADTLEDLGPHIWHAIREMGEYQRRQARGYWQEVKEKR
jgi:hypothetical protein